MRKTSSVILATPILAASFVTAFAQNHNASPVAPVDNAVAQPPGEDTILTSGTEPRSSAIQVASESVRPDRTRNVFPGIHTVAWSANTAGIHQTDGGYRFTIAATDAPENISLQHVWARPSAGLSTTAAAYLTVTNKGATEDRLLGVSTPIGTAELHETTNDNGVMKMRPVSSISLMPGKPVTFQPGGFHVMLTGLKSALKAGDSFPLTLTFEHAQPVTVTAKVEKAAPGMDHGHGGMEGMPGMSGH